MPVLRLLFELALKLADDLAEGIRQVDIGVVELGPVIGANKPTLHHQTFTRNPLEGK